MPLIQQRVQSAVSQHTPLYGKNLDSDHIALLFFTPGSSNICGHARLLESTKLAFISASWVSDSLWTCGWEELRLFFFFLRFTYFCFMCLSFGLCMPGAHRDLKRAMNPLELKFHSCELTHECWEPESDTPHQTPCILENENWLLQVVLWYPHTLCGTHTCTIQHTLTRAHE